MSLRDQLTAIYQANRQLTPKLVVDIASDETHPLHARFEWDDSIAGPKYREFQAADLIRSVRVKFVDASNEERDVRAFAAVRQADSLTANYRPVEEVAQDDIATAILLKQAEREWKTFQRKYSHLTQFMAQIRGELQAGAA